MEDKRRLGEPRNGVRTRKISAVLSGVAYLSFLRDDARRLRYRYLRLVILVRGCTVAWVCAASQWRSVYNLE